MIYEFGSVFEIDKGDFYILAHTNPDKASLINLSSGNRWSDTETINVTATD